MTQLRRIIVLGGGISGLSYAHYLRNFLSYYKKTHLVGKIIVLESDSKMGGSIMTKRFDDGVVHELGPRSVRFGGVRAENTVALLEHLGLGDKTIHNTTSSAAGRYRYIYNHGKLHIIPTSITQLHKQIPGAQTRFASAVFRDLFKAPRLDLTEYPHQDPSIYDFIAHRFGKDAAECLLDPILRGITAGDARKLSTKSLLGDFIDKEQAYGSVIKGMFKPPVNTMPHDDLYPNDIIKSELLREFRNNKVISYNINTGLQSIPERLTNSLLNTNEDEVVSIYNRTKVTSISFDDKDSEHGPCAVTVETVDGDNIQLNGHHIVSAIPSVKLGEVMSNRLRSQERMIIEQLSKIPHAPVGCVTVEYRNLKEPKEMNSFGFLTHSKAGSKVLGISFDSTMFPTLDKPTNSSRLTCMIGGSWFEEMTGTSDVNKVTDGQLEQIALGEISKILNITKEPHRMSTLLWKTGIAQYEPGHKSLLDKSRRLLKEFGIPLTLIGQSYDGVAINDVIFSARMAANEFVKSLE